MRSSNSHTLAAGIGFFLTLIVLLSGLNVSQLTSPLDVEKASARQSIEVDCSNYTFEELFIYDHAFFSLEIDSGWQTAWLEANAWVNGSNSAELRTNLDGLLDGIPGGNNSWLSTDEREAVREVGPDCVGDMQTRMGIREGVAHRSSSADPSGIDWNDLEWFADGIVLDEINLVPSGHSQERNCQSIGASPNCKEVPVTITDDMELSVEKDPEEGRNIDFNKLPNNGQSNFTLAMNMTNMTSTTLQVTFPPINGLRIVEWELTEDGTAVTSIIEPEETIGGDGSLTVTWENAYDLSEWPMIQELFIDFTTAPPETNDPPTWATTAPENGTLIPILNDGTETKLLSQSQITEMGVDEGPISVSCEDTNGWAFTISSEGDLMVTPNGASVEVTCVVVDRYGAQSSSRTWKITQPFTITAANVENMDSVDLTIEPSGLMNEMEISLFGVQEGRATSEITESGIATSTMKSLSLSGLSPGVFSLDVSATSLGMLDWSTNFDIGLSKLSQAPTVSLTATLAGENGTWDSSGYTYSMSGTFYDADGEAVTFVLSVCGFDSQNVNQQGANWDVAVSVAGCTNHDSYAVTLTATDSSGTSSALEVNILPPGATSGEGEGETIHIDPAPKGGGLPAPSMFVSLTALLGAVFFLAQRKE